MWLELGRTAKNSRKLLDGGVLINLVVREKYCEALQAEVEAWNQSDGGRWRRRNEGE